MRGFLRAAGALLCLALSTNVSAQQASGDSLRGWVAGLSWTPQYCEINAASKEPQCRGEHYFVIDRLAPQFAVGTMPECSKESGLDRDAVDRLMWIVPNRHTLRSQWNKQGRCSGLSQDAYFQQVERARRRILIPRPYLGTRDVIDTTPEQLRLAFIDANPGMTEGGIVAYCSSGRWLREVRICLDAGFGFRDCQIDTEDRCGDSIRVRPIRSSRLDRR